MEILVLNGSPKGDLSVTMQYVAFLAKKNPGHTFPIVNIAQRINQLETDPVAFDAVVAQVRKADAVLWAFPVYYMLVHGNFKRFIELVHERGAAPAFGGKYAASLSTSIRFFDHTAHNYINAVADDWGMRYHGRYSAKMSDLLDPAERDRLAAFAAAFLAAAARGLPTARAHQPLVPAGGRYTPGPAAAPVDTGGRKVLLVTDEGPDDANLAAMTARLAAAFTGPVETVNLRDLDIKGGCLGCCRCAWDNTCVYDGSDGFTAFYREKVEPADIVLYAGAVRDRYLSAKWKSYFDRTFFKNHVPTLSGKQFAFLVSGPLAQLANLRQILEAYGEFQHTGFLGIVTDEGDPAHTDALLDRLAADAVAQASQRYLPPPSFLSVAGGKLFRDEIWSRMRFPFVADHKYFKANGLYDFPHRDRADRLRSFLLYWLVHIPAVRKQVYGPQITTHMIAPLKKLVDSL
ncbi:NAD(P)H-dependent oxidoreductase [Anaeroselena agilis]|uniref:NAD(P)H-dependent oxidoreductase n=1 Tax=Anaeroselena agilis TaxID=3063788 RepID=A0ABU3P0D1_9FIRM|nr:NAD(P)H-dependent oxidoreductase [Selenomonadales bacterium 4137-cl]